MTSSRNWTFARVARPPLSELSSNHLILVTRVLGGGRECYAGDGRDR